MIKIAVSGASGRMGQTIIEAIGLSDQAILGVAIDYGDSLDDFIDSFDVLIDFTRPEATIGYLNSCNIWVRGCWPYLKIGMLQEVQCWDNAVLASPDPSILCYCNILSFHSLEHLHIGVLGY